MTTFDYLWVECPTISAEEKRRIIRAEAVKIMTASDWTQIPDSGLTLSEQIAQADIRAQWAGLDLSDPDNVVLPEYPMTERP